MISDLVLSSAFFFFDIAIAVWMYFSWKKDRYPDYFWLSLLFSILVVVKVIGYIFYSLLSPNIGETAFVTSLIIFGSIRGGITFTVCYLAFVILLIKWIGKRTPKKAKIISWSYSSKGILTVFLLSLAFNAIVMSYIAGVLN